MARPGKTNEAETAASLRLLNEKYGDRVFWFRLYDGAQIRKLINLLSKLNIDSEVRSKINSIASYSTYIKQPADFFLLFDGRSYFLEDKSSKNPRRYTFSYVSDHQVEDLIKVSKSGGEGIIMFTNRSKKGQYKRYAVPAQDFKILRDAYLDENIKSCLWEDLKEIGVEIPRLKGSKWGLEVLLNM